jgi:nitrite reductase (NADH) large subunit
MRIVIIGNNVAGTFTAQNIRNNNKDAEIHIYSEENYNYYTRIKLPEVISEEMTIDDLIVFKKDWYENNKINTHLNRKITHINPDQKFIITQDSDKQIPYEKLILAVGSHPNIPPITNANEMLGKGVFTLRSIKDAYTIHSYIKERNCQNAIIIGGGLLGLEIARAVRARGASVQVVEFFPRLLPRQLDPEGAAVLQSKIEDMGIKVRLGTATEEILGEGGVNGLKFKGGDQLEAQTAIVAAGVRPNIRLAADAGLEADKGIVVDDSLQTSHAGIFAAGDNVQHRDKVYGIIPASFNQARVAAFNIAGDEKMYTGTIPSNTLKVVGVDLTSIGLVNPEEGTAEEFRKTVEEQGIYKKIVIQEGKLAGAIWMGTKQNINEINRIILQKIDVEKWKDSLMEEDFDFSVL